MLMVQHGSTIVVKFNTTINQVADISVHCVGAEAFVTFTCLPQHTTWPRNFTTLPSFAKFWSTFLLVSKATSLPHFPHKAYLNCRFDSEADA